MTIGSGAKLLGPITVGHGSKIGANSVVIHDVPPNSTVVGNPGHPVRVEGRRPEGPDADWVHLPDPIADAIKGLAGRIAALERAVDEVAGRAGAEITPLRSSPESGQDGTRRVRVRTARSDRIPPAASRRPGPGAPAGPAPA